MSAAQIYSQYISDYENAAKKYNRGAKLYQNSLVLQGGPVRAKDSNTGQEYGLYSTPDGGRNIVRSGTAEDYQKAMAAADEAQRQNFSGYIEGQGGKGNWTTREGQSPDAIRTFGGWQGGEGYYSDLGNGVAAMRTGGKGTGKYVTERISGDQSRADELASSGRYKDVKFVPGPATTDENGNPQSNDFIDVTYEELAFPDKPGEFKTKKPELSIAQLREISNPTPTVADAEREGGGEVGLIESARNKFLSAKPGLISSSR